MKTALLSATPYALNLGKVAIDSADNITGLAMGSHNILPSDLPRFLVQYYTKRAPIWYTTGSEPGDKRDIEACEHLFAIFQNIDERHLTPDGGRSLWVGDIARIKDDNGIRYFQCMNFGWNEIKS